MEEIVNLSEEEITEIIDSMTPAELENIIEKVNEMQEVLKENLGVQ